MFIHTGYGIEEDIMPFIAIADATEKKALSPFKIDFVYSDVLEEYTGADLMITPLTLPIAPAFLPKHFEAGALLVQIKRGDDLVASVGLRAAKSIGKMVECGTLHSWQRILLYVGTLNASDDGTLAVINGRANSRLGPHTYFGTLGTIEKWIERGGVFSSIPRMDIIPSWMKMKINHILEFSHSPEEIVTAVPDDLYEFKEVKIGPSGVPMQKLIVVKDFRVTLMTLPMMGEKRVQSLFSWMQGKGMKMDLFTALSCLQDPEIVREVPLLNNSVCQKVRAYLGLEDVYEMHLRIAEKE